MNATLARDTRPVLTALRELGGRATVADVVAATGLPSTETEAALRTLLEDRRGHLEVGESGTLVYDFDPDLIARDRSSWWERAKAFAWRGFKKAFKVWIVLMLVVYFVVFVALVIAALFASQSRDGDGGGWGGGGRRGHRHHHGLGNFFFWYWLWSPGWSGRPNYGHRFPYEKGRGRRESRGVPFYKKVFAFVFGPDRPEPTREQLDRSTLRLIRARRGVLSVAELVQHTGEPRPKAEEEMARLMAAYDGDARVSERGEILYVFPGLMVSAHGRVDETGPPPAWRRLEKPRAVTGNDRAANALVAGLNGFNLLAAATAPVFIFPRLGLGGPAAWVGLVWIPVVFSTTFFAVPLARAWGVARENARRTVRNVRRVVLGHVYGASLAGDGVQPVAAVDLVTRVGSALDLDPTEAHRVDLALQEVAAEFDADVEPADVGLEYRFPKLRAALREAEALRRGLELESSSVGEIVYSTADDALEAGERDLLSFDAELASEADRRLERLAPSPEKVDFEEDWEVLGPLP